MKKNTYSIRLEENLIDKLRKSIYNQKYYPVVSDISVSALVRIAVKIFIAEHGEENEQK